MKPTKKFSLQMVLGWNKTSLNTIVRDFLIIREKIHNPENNSFYFRKGIESSTRKMNSLKDEFENIRNIININFLG